MHSWVSSIGALDLDMELKVAREFSKSNAGSMRVVPVVTGEVLKAKYGDKAIQEALNFGYPISMIDLPLSGKITNNSKTEFCDWRTVLHPICIHNNRSNP